MKPIPLIPLIEYFRLASKVLAAKGIGHPYQRNYVTGEHITALMTIRADGVNLPPMIIFRNCLPKTNYAEMGPENALYRATESGYVNSALYLEYVKHLDSVIPGLYTYKIQIMHQPL